VNSFYSTPPLRIARLLFELQPHVPLHLPVEIRGNVLRGAFGTVLQRAVCDSQTPCNLNCPRRDTCAYAMLFEPQWPIQFEKPKAQAAPRGFLFRPTQDSSPDFGPGQPLCFELRLFGQIIDVFPFFLNTFLSLDREGLHGKPVHLSSVQTLDWSGASRGELVSRGKVTRNQPLVLKLGDLRAPSPPDGPIRIDFLTPTCLQHDGKDQRIPTLEALVCCLRDRLSGLVQLYEGCEWQADYGAMGRLAAEAEIVYCHGKWQKGKRRSSRTGQVMPLAGFLGTIVYENVHPALWRMLVVGQEVHVGAHTVWGNGAYSPVLEE
jgi:hypothetical protein